MKTVETGKYIRDVDIEKDVRIKDLESALLKATREMHWTAEVQQASDQSLIMYLYGFFPALTVTFGEKNKESVNKFYVLTGFPIFGIASKKKVDKYISYVSKYV